MMRALALIALLASACGISVAECVRVCGDRGVERLGYDLCVCGPRPRVCPTEGVP